MAQIKCFAISCSSDAEVDARKLYVWGAIKFARWLPESVGEAKKRIKRCQQEHKCVPCDAEIHKIVIERTEKTKKHQLS